MLELLVFLAIVGCAVFLRREYILYMFILLFPFHGFIKNCFDFFFRGGEIFALWKEVLILLLLYKVYRDRHLNVDRNLILLIVLLIGVIFLFFWITLLGSDSYTGAIPKLRDYLFPMLLFLAVSAMKIEGDVFRKMMFLFTVTVLVTNGMGVTQHFFFNLPIKQLMGSIELIGSDGTVYYASSSYRIMGFERMSGIMGGGPNMFGVFNGLATVVLGGVLLNRSDFTSFSLSLFRWMRIALLAAGFGLIFSFSRAGWCISFLGVLMILYRKGLSNYLKYIFVLGIGAVLVFMALNVFYPQAVDVIANSVTGKEVSAADRTGNVERAMSMVLEEPLGHGIGLTDNRQKSLNTFFSESAFMNLGYELGVPGLLLLICIHFYILRLLLNRRNSALAFICFSVSLCSVFTSFFSINPYNFPYLYYWWLLIGLGINYSPEMNSK